MADITAGSVKSKKKKKISIFPIVNGIIMVLFLIITLYPVLNTLAISLNDGTDALRGGIYLLPRKFTWKNYITVLQKDNLITRSIHYCCQNNNWNSLSTGGKCNPCFYSQQKKIFVQKRFIPVLGYHNVCQWWINPYLPPVQGTWAYQ